MEVAANRSETAVGDDERRVVGSPYRRRSLADRQFAVNRQSGAFRDGLRREVVVAQVNVRVAIDDGAESFEGRRHEVSDATIESHGYRLKQFVQWRLYLK